MSHDRFEMLTLGGTPSSVDAPHLLGSLASADLNVNLLRFTGEGGIEAHVNREVDVLLVALDGEGVVTIDGTEAAMTAGQALIIPKGTERSIRAAGDRFAWLTCHGQRRGLRPTPRQSPFRTDEYV